MVIELFETTSNCNPIKVPSFAADNKGKTYVPFSRAWTASDSSTLGKDIVSTTVSDKDICYNDAQIDDTIHRSKKDGDTSILPECIAGIK